MIQRVSYLNSSGLSLFCDAIVFWRESGHIIIFFWQVMLIMYCLNLKHFCVLGRMLRRTVSQPIGLDHVDQLGSCISYTSMQNLAGVFARSRSSLMLDSDYTPIFYGQEHQCENEGRFYLRLFFYCLSQKVKVKHVGYEVLFWSHFWRIT